MAESALDRLNQRLQSRRQAESAQAAPGHTYTIAICDDEVRNLEALERVLRERYQVLRYDSGEAVIQALSTGQAAPDLVITDQRMPGMTGVELLEKVRALRPHCMRLILSGYTDKSDLIAAINRGNVYQYISKPWGAEELMLAVGKSLELYQLKMDQEVLNERLHEANVKLIETNARLEEMVAQRTSTLKQVNEELHRVNEQLARMAVTDSLTGLFNHRFFDEFLERELKRSLRYRQPISVVMADIDHFKRYNDQHGHQVGDRVLQRMSEILRARVRDPDVVARYGGEEFIMILPQTKVAGAVVTAERLRVEICGYPFPHGDDPQTGPVTMSFGVAGLDMEDGGPPVEHMSPSELVSRADRALYRSKHEGRNRVSAFAFDSNPK